MHEGSALIDASPESAAGGGTGRESDIRLTLPANAENVVLARLVVGELAETLGLSRSAVDDVKLAVTEACTNVVRHAYAGALGTLELEIERCTETMVVVVTDRGRGLRPSAEGDGAGLGLPLMAALSNGLEIDQAPGSGSRVRMSFRRSG